MPEIICMRPDKNSINGLKQLVNFIYEHNKTNEKLNMIEVGSYAGESMEIFATTNKIKKITCIDPWKPGWNNKELSSNSNLKFAENLFDARKNKVEKKYATKIIKYKGTLSSYIQANLNIQIDKPDFVYIDACHLYDAVVNDIKLFLNNLRPNIAICGHDYWDKQPDVYNAVNDILGKPTITFCDTSYCKLI